MSASQLPASVAALRRPVWSGLLTEPLARAIPPEKRRGALSAIKGIHTAIFASVFAALLLALWDGISGRPTRRTAIAAGVVVAETAVYVSNNQVCPLTPLAEDLGAGQGSVVDIFLPAAIAHRIPLIAGGTALLAGALNLRAMRQAAR